MWLELNKTKQGGYKVVKEKLVAKLRPPEFVSLDKFHARKLRLDKKLLERAMLGIDAVTRDQLVIH